MRNGCSISKLNALTALLLIQLNFVVHAAPALPDSGQTMRELQQQPELSAPKTTTPLRLEEEATASKSVAVDDARIEVKAVKVTGNTVFPADELEALATNLIGGEHTLAELEAVAMRITTHYRERGYVIARAYIPVQEIKEGVVAISVMEGRIGEWRVNNRSRLSDERANNYLNGIKSGDTLQAKPVDRAILLLNDMPGVGSARATLQPGASVGTSDLLIELDPSTPYAASAELDNYGNYYTGEYRLGGILALNSPLKIGDQITLRAMTTDQDMTYARLAYQVPVGGSGLKLGVAYSDVGYRLGKEFAALQAHGTATSSSLFAVYPFIRSLTSNFSGTFTLEDKKLNDRIDATSTFADKRVLLVNFGLAGNHQSATGGAGATSFDLSLVKGNLSMDADSLAHDNLLCNGAFTRLAYSINHQQRLTDTNSLSLSLSGQQASKNLNSSEKFSLGGANAVRAFPQGEGDGDEGWLVNMELRHDFTPALQGAMFYDAGSVSINRNPFVSGTANTRSISGAGLGANATMAGVQIKTYLAWRTSGGLPIAEPATLNRNPRLWLQASKQF